MSPYGSPLNGSPWALRGTAPHDGSGITPSSFPIHRSPYLVLANEEEKERRRRTYEEARALYESQVRARDDDKLTPVTKRWLEWAKAKADWLDPLVRRSDPILDAPEPEAPSDWGF